MKICSQCKQSKQKDLFHKNKTLKDGLQHICKQCTKLNHPYDEKRKAYDKLYKSNNQEKIKQYKRNYRKTFGYRFSSVKDSAKKRNLKFSLSENEVRELITQKCFYCQRLTKNYNGIDRLNNEEGYVSSNCVSCCEQCNNSKNNYTIKEFYEMCKLVADNPMLRDEFGTIIK